MLEITMETPAPNSTRVSSSFTLLKSHKHPFILSARAQSLRWRVNKMDSN